MKTLVVGDCWEWMGARNSDGYGHKRIAGKTVSVHRLSYEATYGTIPAGYSVLHRCDNRACFNPEHLFVGTQADNVKDMRSKGRDVPPPKVRGEKASQAKQSDEIYEFILTSKQDSKTLSAFLGIPYKTLWQYRKRNQVCAL